MNNRESSLFYGVLTIQAGYLSSYRFIASAVVLPEPSELPPPPASPPNALKRRQSSISEYDDGKRRRISIGEEARSRRESIPSAPASGRGPETRKGQGNIDAVERKRGQRLFGVMLGALSQGSSSTSQRRRANIEQKQLDKLKLQEKELGQKKKERYQALVAMRKREQKKFDEESVGFECIKSSKHLADSSPLDAHPSRKSPSHGPLPSN